MSSARGVESSDGNWSGTAVPLPVNTSFVRCNSLSATNCGHPNRLLASLIAYAKRASVSADMQLLPAKPVSTTRPRWSHMFNMEVYD